jgi:predicted DNA-binding transcriptional regulator YafY
MISKQAMSYKSRGDAGVRIERLMRLLNIIRHHPSGRPLTKESLAEEFGINSKTIQRDITFLNNRIEGCDIRYDAKKRTWTIVSEPTMPHIHLDDDEKLSLLFVAALIENIPFPASDSAKRALDKMLEGLGSEWKDLAREWRHSLITSTFSSRIPEQAVIQEVQEAIQSRQSLLLDYDSRSSGRRERLFYPYGIDFRGVAYWIHGYLPDRERFVPFAADRIYAIERHEVFDRDEAGWQTYQSTKGVGGFSDGITVPVHVRFAPEVAGNVKEQHWSESLSLAEAEDGAIWLQGSVSGLPFLVCELLRWRRFVYVQGGSELRDAYNRELEAMSILQTMQFTPPQK